MLDIVDMADQTTLATMVCTMDLADIMDMMDLVDMLDEADLVGMVNKVQVVDTVDMLSRVDLLDMMDMVDITDIVDMIEKVDMVDTKSQHTLIIRTAQKEQNHTTGISCTKSMRRVLILEPKNQDGLSYKILHPKAIKSYPNKHLMTTTLFTTKAMSTRLRVTTIKRRQMSTTS